MAPVKRSTATAQRETRSTRAAAVAKKNATTAEKKALSPVSKKTAVSTKSTSTGRRTRKADEDTVMEVDELTAEEDQISETKTTRGTARTTAKIITKKPATSRSTTTTSNTVAPRRRIKVTPLDSNTDSLAKEPTKATRGKTLESSITKKAASTPRHAPDEVESEAEDAKIMTTKNTVSSKKSATKPKSASVAAKSRSKSSAKVTSVNAEPETTALQEVVVPVTRMTRARTGSTATQQSDVAEAIAKHRVTKATTGTRKKVTFQDLPEDDKENQPLASTKAKKAAAAKSDTKTVSKTTGIRAKPVRATATSTATRGRKTTQSDKSASKASSIKEQKNMPTVLTPKKITQVAKGTARVDQDADLSDEEDELNGGKTPVRDLSMSPRRPPTSALAKAMSPVKKLSFTPSLAQASPSQEGTTSVTNVFGQSAMLASPARRLPASPFKDGLKDSPKRGMGESTRLLFPSHAESQQDGTASLALNVGNISTASQTMATLLQSPKRTGNFDSDFFSQSAMKKSVPRSPFKTSLLASPAKRLFSPAKKLSKPTQPRISDLDMDTDGEGDRNLSPLSAQEISATSNFRTSMSPFRVHRVEQDVIPLDFDESVLPIGSPFKVVKSTLKEPEILPGVEDVLRNVDDLADLAAVTAFECPSVNPSELEKPAVRDNIAEEARNDELLTEKPADVANPHQEGATEQEPTGNRNDEAEASSTAFKSLGLFKAEEKARFDHEASSEDELAADETPVRTVAKHGTAKINALSRQSFGVPPSAAGKGYGFTPLVAQMSDWLASSPRKTPKPRLGGRKRVGSFEFTPVAAQHLDGEVVTSRGSTPVQKMSKRDLLSMASGSRSRDSLDSNTQRPSIISGEIGLKFPQENPQFEELMEAQTLVDTINQELPDTDTEVLIEDNAHFKEIMSLEATQPEIVPGCADDTILVNENGSDDEAPQTLTAELTTDLINFTNTSASDTAMVDFQKLAEEAEQLASVDPEAPGPGSARRRETMLSTCEEVAEDQSSGSDNAYGDENELPALMDPDGDASLLEDEPVVEQFPLPEDMPSPILQATIHDTVSPSLLDIGAVFPSSPGVESGNQEEQPISTHAIVTPLQSKSSLSRQRLVNTVVSKVPLKPEGHVSPIKMTRKRARSFGNEADASAKRLSLSGLKELQIPQVEESLASPDRRTRTSVAPSPGGTSTPASRYPRSSFGAQSLMTTTGQMSFAVDDFGDSTLDGIELPDDFTQMTIGPGDSDLSTPAPSEKTYGLASMMATPAAMKQATPGTLKRSVRRVTAPASVTKSSAPVKQTPQRKSLQAKPERTPLKPVGGGVLDGAVVYVDVHTTEGADASGIFIELLNQMGARCVKEWRWNPRASLAVADDAQPIETNIGITHVVYKDGGKRTLEKVRDARGEVLCVGVAWVLDCEREGKWLDESNYAVDTTLLPRGGSRRRKSMEPRALLNSGNGSVLTNKPRRSISAEMSETMKRELINTPVRGRELQQNVEPEDDEEDVPAATPTGFISYDPRTAMTPGTPYLVGQGKEIVQMSAPPKQTGKRLFEDDNDENELNGDRYNDQGARGLDSGKVVSDAKKFKMKNLDMKSRRRTLGFKPLIGSPLSRTDRN